MIRVKVTEPTGTIILDRAERCNALSRQMVEQLTEALDDLRQEKRVRGIVISGAGEHFCAGLDLQELHETTSANNAWQQWHADTQALQALIEAMLQLPKPIVAAVDGAALASGLALVLAADLVVASPKSVFGVPAPRLGLVSGVVAPLLAFRGGGSLASRVLLGGESLTAEQAVQFGIVHHLVAPEQVWVRSSAWIDALSASAAEALQLTKRVLNEMIGEQLGSLLASGAAATATSLTTEAAQEGLRAFTDKRPPQFP